MFNTDEFFINGKLGVLIDVAFGSSAKGTLEDFLVDNSDKVDFLCTTNSSNASHTVMRRDGFEFVYKTLPSGSHHHDKLEKVFIGHGAAIELEALYKEIDKTGIPREKVGISPITPIIQQADKDYEGGKCTLEGEYKDDDMDGTIKTGTTASGSGAVRAKKVLRRKDLLLARDIDEISDMICDVSAEILELLRQGKAGLLAVGQGFALSQGLHQFYPYTTSRSVTVASALNDMFLPITVVGNVILNDRSMPIRIFDKKFKCKESGDYLTWDEKNDYDYRGKSYEIIESYSGDFYEDSKELTWDEVTEMSGSPKPLWEQTTLTKLPRRIATHSFMNLIQAINQNQTPHQVFISVSFANYIDWDMYEKSGKGIADKVTLKFMQWLKDNITDVIDNTEHDNVKLAYISTSPYSEDFIVEKNK